MHRRLERRMKNDQETIILFGIIVAIVIELRINFIIISFYRLLDDTVFSSSSVSARDH